ncbi:MAG: xanthine dehydrogenase small subunit [Bacteroidales bacterium]|nr:xanthine dehydrogenase small subunit [Bacteroidales bacterium]
MKKNVAHTISFVLDDQIVTIDFEKQGISPTTTVLNYLRSLHSHKGVKEGCAEGDCGACTVVLAEPDGQRLKYRALNSCLLFLPSLHGKQLITVENLAFRSGNEIRLHPVQQAMVEYDGSQCGYCTPGILMSMFALYKSHSEPSEETIRLALAGNLCRCTGYTPILRAARQVCRGNGKDRFSDSESATLAMLMQIQHSDISIITSTQKYFKPSSFSSAFDLMEKHPDYVIVNGSTDIALRQTKKFEKLNPVIDLSGIRELKTYVNTPEGIEIGAGFPLEDLIEKPDDRFSAFSEMLKVFASKQIRNTATPGGNIGTASPIGDTLPLLIAYGAMVKLEGKKSGRTIPLENFIAGYRQTALQPGEIIKSIILPAPQNAMVRFYKVSNRKDVDISTVSAGFSMELSAGKITGVCLAFGGMAEMPLRAKAAENYLLHRDWTSETVATAAEIIRNSFAPIADARSGIEYRKTVAGNLLIRFYEETKNNHAPSR